MTRSNNWTGLAIRFGFVWGAIVLLTGWSAIVCSWCARAVDAASLLYIGYSSTFLGGIIGFAWGFINAALIGAIIALAKETLTRNESEIRQKA